LNSGLKDRRFDIGGFPFLDCILLIENCPVFGVHYTQDLSALLVKCGKQTLAILEEKLDISNRLTRSRVTMQTVA
jgi:hypothetical protein